MNDTLEREPDPLGIPAVGRDLPVGVEDERVDDIGLGGDARDVLLERGEVVEQDRTVRDRRQVPRQHLAAALDLVDDRCALAMLHHHEHRGHHRGDHQEGAQEKLRPQRAGSHRTRSSQIFRNGM